MEALFIGQTYIDVTLLADEIPQGDEKAVARDYAVSFGGNAVTAAFACAKLGHAPDLLTSLADDWLGRMFLDMAAKYAIPVHGRKVKRSSLSFILPQHGKRAILRARRHLSAPVSDPQHRGRARAASRRPSVRRGDPLCEGVSPSRRADLARRRWPALQHA